MHRKKKFSHLAPGCTAFANGLDADLGPGVAHELGVLGKQVVPEESPQDRVDLLLSEVARSSEDDKSMS